MTPAKDSLIDRAVSILNRGGVVAFPTDTVYGIGAHPCQPEAIRKLYQVKGRPIDKPIPILLGSICDVERVAQNVPESFFQLAHRFWPGELTLIVEAKNLPPEVTAGGKTVGLRMPNHSLALKLLHRFGRPIATTSANKSEETAGDLNGGSTSQTWETHRSDLRRWTDTYTDCFNGPGSLGLAPANSTTWRHPRSRTHAIP